MTELLNPLEGVTADTWVKCRANYSALHILKEDWLAIAQRPPEDGEIVVVLIDGKAKLGRFPVADASGVLGVVAMVVRRTT